MTSYTPVPKYVERALYRIQSHSIPLYERVDIRKNPVKAGSGVLIENNNIKYLVTASHVGATKPASSPIGFWHENTFSPIRGLSVFTHLPVDDNIDTIDLWIWCLTNETVARLESKGYKFFSIGIDIEFKTVENPDGFLIAGFPNSRKYSKYDPISRRQKCNPVFMLTNILEEQCTNIDLVLNYENKKPTTRFRDGSQGKPVHPRGLSGCGIWYIPNFGTWDYYLVGILRQFKKTNRIILANHVDSVYTLIESPALKKWPIGQEYLMQDAYRDQALK